MRGIRTPVVTTFAADAITSLWPVLDHTDRDLSGALRVNTVMLDEHTRPSVWRPSTHWRVYRVSSSLTAAGLYEQVLEYDQALTRLFPRSADATGVQFVTGLSLRLRFLVAYSV
jgi:hypothetical protein